MATTRENSQGQGTFEYTEGKYTITRMGNDEWYVFVGKEDQNKDFKTLAAARKWCKANPYKEDGPSYSDIMERWNLDANNGAKD